MSRRSTSPLGLYHLILRGHEGRDIFLTNSDYAAFGNSLADVLRRTRYSVHGFCFLPDQVHLAVRMSDIALGDFVLRLVAPYSRIVQHRRGRSGPLFDGHHEARLADEKRQALEVIRTVHLSAVRARFAADPASYVWSGHRTYLGLARVPWLQTRLILKMFGSQLQEMRTGYQQFIMERVVRPAGAADVGCKASEAVCSLDDLIAWIARLQNEPVDEVLSISRRRACSLTRALIAWHATRMGVATLSEVARRLNRDPSTLFVAIQRYRALRPGLFAEPGNVAAGNDAGRMQPGRAMVQMWSPLPSKKALQENALRGSGADSG